VLIVEDEEANLGLGKRILEGLAYEVATAPTPREALRYVTAEGLSPDLSTTDIVMPQMNGRALAERLSTVVPSLECLCLSGYAADEAEAVGEIEPGSRFLQKPFSMAALAEKLRGILDDG
jgi:CheY-like chemotaxis protein